MGRLQILTQGSGLPSPKGSSKPMCLYALMGWPRLGQSFVNKKTNTSKAAQLGSDNSMKIIKTSGILTHNVFSLCTPDDSNQNCLRIKDKVKHNTSEV